MRVILAFLLFVSSAYGWGTLQQDFGYGGVLWYDNLGTSVTTEQINGTRAVGQRMEGAGGTNPVTLDRIELEISGTSGTLTMECRIGVPADQTTYTERWTGIPVADGTITLTSTTNYTFNNYIYFSCLRDSGAGTANLSYTGDTYTATAFKKIEATSGWVLDTVETNDIRARVYGR